MIKSGPILTKIATYLDGPSLVNFLCTEKEIYHKIWLYFLHRCGYLTERLETVKSLKELKEDCFKINPDSIFSPLIQSENLIRRFLSERKVLTQLYFHRKVPLSVRNILNMTNLIMDW